MTRYHLRNEKQDLLYVDIQGSYIVNGVPFRWDIYVNLVSVDALMGKTLKVGDYIRYASAPDRPHITIPWPIVKIEVLK